MKEKLVILLALISIGFGYQLFTMNFPAFIAPKRSTLEKEKGYKDYGNFCTISPFTTKHHLFPQEKIKFLVGRGIRNLLVEEENHLTTMDKVIESLNNGIKKIGLDVGTTDVYEDASAFDTLYHDVLWMKNNLVCGPSRENRGDDNGEEIDKAIVMQFPPTFVSMVENIFNDLECKYKVLNLFPKGNLIEGNLFFQIISNNRLKECEKVPEFIKLKNKVLTLRAKIKKEFYKNTIDNMIRKFLSFDSIIKSFLRIKQLPFKMTCKWKFGCGKKFNKYCVSSCKIMS